MIEPHLVLVSEPLAPSALEWLGARSRVVSVDPDIRRSPKLLAEADALVVRTRTRVDVPALDAAPRLRVVGRAGAGLDAIDVGACRERGIDVVYTPDANTQAVVEFVLGVMCDACRPRQTLTTPLDDAGWARCREAVVVEQQMSELTLGILGYGRIGSRLGSIAGVVGMDVIYHDLVEIPPERRGAATPVPLETLLGRSNILSIHVDGRASNRGFVDGDRLALLHPDAVLINTSRGFVVDNRAFAAFLASNPRARAFLDVHDPEPFDEHYPLLGLAGVTLTPHIASRTKTAITNMSWVVRDVVDVLEGREPRFRAPVVE